MDPLVFIYGTLRRGEINDLDQAALRAGLSAPLWLGAALAPGRLVDFGRWPGLIEQAGPARIVGELVRVSPALLALMDEIEEYAPPAPSVFVRRRVTVELGGRRLAAFYYPVDPLRIGLAPAISAWDWITYRQQRGSSASRVLA